MKLNQTEKALTAILTIFLIFLAVGIADANLRKEKIKPPNPTELRRLLDAY
jgi:hypothetical protein